MKNVIALLKPALAALVLVLSPTTSSAQTVVQWDPYRGMKEVFPTECRIDFRASVNPSGSRHFPNRMAEAAGLQMAKLVSKLPEHCLEKDECLLVNIDEWWYIRLWGPRFLEHLDSDTAEIINTAIRDCRVNFEVPVSLVEGGGGATLSCGDDGNTLVLSINGTGNTFSSSQTGCNLGQFTLTGNNIRVYVTQVGRNGAVVSINGNNINFSLDQRGEQHFAGTITSSTSVSQH